MSWTVTIGGTSSPATTSSSTARCFFRFVFQPGGNTFLIYWWLISWIICSLVAGLERVPDDPWLSRRAFLRHPLHRNLPWLPSGSPHHLSLQQPSSRPVSCGSSQPIIALTIASSHSCHEFLFEIIRCLNPDHGVAKFLDEGGSVFIEWGHGPSQFIFTGDCRGGCSVFIDSPNPPLTPTYKFPRLTRLNCPPALNTDPQTKARESANTHGCF